MNENTYTSMGNAIGEIKVSQKTEIPKKIYSKTDGIFAVMYMLLGYGFVRFFFFYDWSGNFDFVFPFYTCAYIITTISYARAKDRQIPKESWFWVCVMLCIALMFKLERFFCLLIQICIAAYFTGVTGGLYGGGTSAYIIPDIWHITLTAPFSNFVSVFPAFFSLFKKEKKNEKKQIPPAVWGMAMGIIALWFIIPLLISADSNFLSGTTDFINHLLGSLNIDSFMQTVVAMVLSLPVTCYLYSLAYSYMNNTKRLFDRQELDSHRASLRISPAVTLKVFMYIICAVYLMFIFLQAEYLLGAFMGRLYGNMTYAQYARTGFFELCKVSVINLSVLAICNLLIKKEGIKAIKLPMLVLCVLSLLLLSTATAKMAMYICAYGLTVKRVVSTVFLLWLVAVFVMCITRLYKPFNLVKTAVITGAVMFCVLISFDIGMESHKFNEKYGFEEKIAIKEYAVIDSEVKI
ncbi:MAG: DUF4173 domain-containing protein [Ruminococcaceae bacterium]|nr:DUF4173 domain-containing protein [Oscillospiraceae bacterium]